MTTLKAITPPTRQEILDVIPAFQRIWEEHPSITIGQMKTSVRRMFGPHWYKLVMSRIKHPHSK